MATQSTPGLPQLRLSLALELCTLLWLPRCASSAWGWHMLLKFASVWGQDLSFCVRVLCAGHPSHPLVTAGVFSAVPHCCHGEVEAPVSGFCLQWPCH